FERPPPGVGTVTATVRLPCWPTRLPGTVAVRCVESINFVGSAVVFSQTCESKAKFLPITAISNEELPAIVSDGVTTSMTGTDRGLRLTAWKFTPSTLFTPRETACLLGATIQAVFET